MALQLSLQASFFMQRMRRQDHKYLLARLNDLKQKIPTRARRRWGFRFRVWLGQQEGSDLLEDAEHPLLFLEEEGVVRVFDPEEGDLLALVRDALHEQVIARAHGQDLAGEGRELDLVQRREDLQRGLSLLRMHHLDQSARHAEAVRVMARHHDLLDLLGRLKAHGAPQERTQHRTRRCEHGSDHSPEPNANALHPAQEDAADEEITSALAHSASELRTQRVRDQVRALVGDVTQLPDGAIDVIVVGVALVGDQDHVPARQGREERDDRSEEELDVLWGFVSPRAREQDKGFHRHLVASISAVVQVEQDTKKQGFCQPPKSKNSPFRAVFIS